MGVIYFRDTRVPQKDYTDSRFILILQACPHEEKPFLFLHESAIPDRVLEDERGEIIPGYSRIEKSGDQFQAT